MKNKLFIGLVLIQCAILVFLLIDNVMTAKALEPKFILNGRLVKDLMITDLALWSEARYTRHPSQADIFSPFQDFPGAPEHFPSGSIIGPPGMLSAGLTE